MAYGDGGMAPAASARCAIGEVLVGIAFRADLAIDDALGAHASSNKIARHRTGEAYMTLPHNNRLTEFGSELLDDFDTDFEAFAANVRADVSVELNGVFAYLRGERTRGLRCDMRDRPAPPSVHHGESAAWRNDDQGQAVGIVEQCRRFRNADDERIGSFGSPSLRLIGTSLLNAHNVRPMHLTGNDKPRIGRPKRLEHDLPVPQNRLFVIFDMQSAVQAGIRPFAHPARAAGEGNAHACLREEALVSKSLQSAMRPQRERIELRQGKLRAACHDS